jgi:membrane protein YqaA with SNARE-associated domain
VKHFFVVLFSQLVHLGGFGLLILGIFDSSFLVLPLGNDLLMVVLTARHRNQMLYFAAMATAGSLLGCLIIDAISRKGGEALIKKHLSKRRLEYVQRKMDSGATWALCLAAMMPPPFPFTPFVMAASAFQYPRRKLFISLGLARFARFAIEGGLALMFGRRILQVIQTPGFAAAMYGLVAISVIASVISLYSWLKKSKR